jgi:hypothetical protein
VYSITVDNDSHTYWTGGCDVANCGEVTSSPFVDGRAGWGMCNLCEINMKKARTRDEFIEACRAAAVLGTVQATYMDFPFLGPETRSVAERDALRFEADTLTPDETRDAAQCDARADEIIARAAAIKDELSDTAARRAELVEREYHDKEGRTVRVESKVEAKKRLKRSPDRADAFLLLVEKAVTKGRFVSEEVKIVSKTANNGWQKAKKKKEIATVCGRKMRR